MTNPCNVATGNKFETEVDYAPDTHGGLRFARHYNSLGPYRSGENFANSWRHSYNRAMDEKPDKFAVPTFASSNSTSGLYVTSDEACQYGWEEIKDTAWSGDLSDATGVPAGGNICDINVGGATKAFFLIQDVDAGAAMPASSTIHSVSRPNGSLIYFEQSGANWVSQFHPGYKLEASGSDWIFTDLNDTRETYDSSGKLIAVEYRNGQTETLIYDLSIAEAGDSDPDTLDLVSGPFDHELLFSYDANGRLAAVTTPDGTIQYGYDSDDNLVSVTYPDATVREYFYEDPDLPNHLTGRIDENDDRVSTYDYDDSGRAILSEHAGDKEQVMLTYNSNGSTTLTLGSGASRTYSFAVEQGARRVSGIVGDVCSQCPGGTSKDRTYDANGFLDEVTDWNGVATKTERNSRGLTETRTEAKNTTEERVKTTVWNSTYRVPDQIISSKNVTTFGYDSDGNPTLITITGTGLTRTWTMTYNAAGQPLTVDGPRTDVSDVTTYDYYNCATGDECGQLESVTNALGQVTTYDSYDASGRVTQITGPNGLVTTLTYDVRGNVLTVTETPTSGTARTTTLTYDDAGQLETVTSPIGTVLTYDYDAAHYLRSVTDNLGNSVEYNYFRTYDPSTGRYLESDPIGLGGGLNTYGYVGGNPLSGIDPYGLDCVALGGSVTCTAPGGGPTVTFPRPKGWPDTINSGSSNYHSYNIPVPLNGADAACVKQGVINNPTPGSPSPASPNGTLNNATPTTAQNLFNAIDLVSSFGNDPGGYNNSPVRSYTMNNGNTVVNVTQPGHPLHPGYVARTTNGSTVNNYGEGTGFLQGPYSPVAGQINGVWNNQTQNIIDSCGCQ